MPEQVEPIENYRSKGAICQQLQQGVAEVDVVLTICEIQPCFYLNGIGYFDNAAVDAIRRKLVKQ